MTQGADYRARERQAKDLYKRARIDRQIESAAATIEANQRPGGFPPSGLPGGTPPPGLERAEAAKTRLAEAKRVREQNQTKIGATVPEGDVKLTPAEAEAWSKPFSYFVGKKVVTQEEIDALTFVYSRWAEAAINLVIPTIFLYVAVCVSVDDAWLPLGVVLAAVVFLLVAGGRALDYKYKRKVRELIAGRLEKIKAEENKELGTIQEALVGAEKLLAKYKAELDELKKGQKP